MMPSRFTYASTRVGFGSPFGSGNALQRLQSQRAAMASNLASVQAKLASVSTSFATAQQDKVAGLGTLAAQAAIARVQAEAKVKSVQMTQQIDKAQRALADAKAANDAKPKFVSWALTPTVDTTA